MMYEMIFKYRKLITFIYILFFELETQLVRPVGDFLCVGREHNETNSKHNSDIK